MAGNAVIRLRRDTAANWTSANPVLTLGEPGFEKDTNKVKIGDGVTAWNSLPYLAATATISAGDKGDITVGGGGGWTIDADVISTYGRTLTSASTAALARGILGLTSVATEPPSNIAFTVADRTALAALAGANNKAVFLREGGREGAFVWDGSNLSAKVSADPNQGIYVAPASATTGASGAWVRHFDGPAVSLWWGVSAANTPAGNVAAMNAAIATMRALRVTGIGYGNGGSVELYTPAGHYQFNAKLSIDFGLTLSGDFAGMFSGGGTYFDFNNATDGIELTKDVGYAHVYGILIGGTALPTSATAGLKCRGKAIAHNLFIAGFGRGIDCYGNFASDGTNTNGSRFVDIATQSCGWGTWSQGPDANNMVFENVASIGNIFGGHADRSFLGNLYHGGDCSTNGNSPTYPTRCVYSGKVYAVAIDQETWCSTNAPTGTTSSNQGWIYLSTGTTGPDGATPPTWTSGQTWYFSAPFCHKDNNARTIFDGIYVEFDQNPCIITWPCTVRTAQQYVAVRQPNGLPAGRVFGAGGTDDSLRYPFQGNYEFSGYTLTQGQIIGGSGFDIRGDGFLGYPSNPGSLVDTQLTIANWNEYSRLVFRRQGTDVASIQTAFGSLRMYCDGGYHFRKGNDDVIAILDAPSRSISFWKDSATNPSAGAAIGHAVPGSALTSDMVFSLYDGAAWAEKGRLSQAGNLTATGNIISTYANAGAGAYGLAHAPTPNGQAAVYLYNGGSIQEWLIRQVHGSIDHNLRFTTKNGSTFIDRMTLDETTGDLAVQGAITGSNLSGTNTGDQFTSVAASKLLGRTSAGAGAAQEITLGTNLSMSGTTLNATGGGGGTTTNAVTFNTSGGAAAGTSFNGSAAVTVDFSTVGAAKTGAVTGSNLTMATARLLGRTTASTGAIEEISAGATLSLTGGSLSVAKVPNAVTWNNGGAGAASGSTYDGSAAITISYNTIGAAPLASPTFTGKVTTAASATGGAGLNLPHGVAPTSPVNGDTWTTTGGLFARINGASVQFATGNGTATGTNTGDQTITLTGNVTGSGTGSFATTIAAGVVANSMLANAAALSVKGNATNASATPTDIAASADGQVLLRSDTSLAFGTVATAGITDAAVTLAKMANVATGTVFYRKTAATGVPEVQTLATLKTDLGLTGTNSGDQTITLTGDVTGSGTGSFATTIGANKVTDSMLAQIATASFKGRKTAGTGNVEALTGTDATALLDVFTSTLKGLAPASGGGTTNFLRADGTWAAPPGGGGGVSDGDKGDVVVSGSGTVYTVESAAGNFAAAGDVLLGNHTSVSTASPRVLDMGGTYSSSAGAAPKIQLYNDGTNVAGIGMSTGQMEFMGAATDKFGYYLGGTLRMRFGTDGYSFQAITATPALPGADYLTFTPQRLNASGGRVWPRWRDEAGVYTTVATHPGRNSCVLGQAIGGATTAIAPVGMAALSTVGTATARNWASTNRLTRARRLAYVSAATAGAAGGLINAAVGHNIFTTGGVAGGGFLAIFRFGVSDASLVAGAHMMVGMRNSISVPTVSTNPNTLTQTIACCQTNGSTNWQICYGGTAAQTAIDTGIAINLTSELEFALYARPDVNNKVTWRLEDISTGTVASGELTGTAGTALPSNTTSLGPIMWRSNNATAAAVGIDIISYYFESDI